MATPVKDIFEPRPTKIGPGTFVKNMLHDEGKVHVVAIYERHAYLVDLTTGGLWSPAEPISDDNKLSLRETETMLGGDISMRNWSVLSRAEAAAELAKMK